MHIKVSYLHFFFHKNVVFVIQGYTNKKFEKKMWGVVSSYIIFFTFVTLLSPKTTKFD